MLMTLEEEAVDYIYIPGRSYLLPRENHGRFSIKKWLGTLPRYILAHFCTLINATKTTILLKYQGMCKVLVVDGLPTHGATGPCEARTRGFCGTAVDSLVWDAKRPSTKN